MQIPVLLLRIGMLIGFFSYLWLAVVAFKRHVAWGLAILLTAPISAVLPVSALAFAATNWYTAKKAFLVYIAAWALMIAGVFGVYNVYYPMFKQTFERIQTGALTQEEAQQQLAMALVNGDTSLPPLPAEPAKEKPQTASGAGTGTQEKTDTPKPSPQVEQPKNETAGSAVPDKPLAEKSDKAAIPPAKQGTAQPADTQNIPNLSQVQPDPLAQKNTVPSDTEEVKLSDVSRYIGRYLIVSMKGGNEHRGILRSIDAGKLVLDRKLYGGNFVFRVRRDQIKSIKMLKRIPAE